MPNLPGTARRRRRFSPFARRWWLIAFALLLPTAPLPAQTLTSEYEVKALFLLNFMRFVDWPPGAFADPAAPIVVGILGENPFGPLLRDALRQERVRGRPIIVREFTTGADPAGCHVLFLSRTEREQSRAVLHRLRSTPTLTVSELESFCQQGGMIRLLTRESSVRFEINPSAATAAGLHVSAKLLQLATAVVRPASAPPP